MEIERQGEESVERRGERENENTEAEQMTEGRLAGKKRRGAEMMGTVSGAFALHVLIPNITHGP